MDSPAKPPLALYHSPTCAYSRRVRAAIRRLGIDVDLRDRANPEHREELRAATGRVTVPVLRIEEGGEVRWMPESEDIIDFLFERAGRERSAASRHLPLAMRLAALACVVAGAALGNAAGGILLVAGVGLFIAAKWFV